MTHLFTKKIRSRIILFTDEAVYLFKRSTAGDEFRLESKMKVSLNDFLENDSAAKDIIKDERIKNGNYHLVLPDEAISVRRYCFPFSDKKKIKNSVKFKIKRDTFSSPDTNYNFKAFPLNESPGCIVVAYLIHPALEAKLISRIAECSGKITGVSLITEIRMQYFSRELPSSDLGLLHFSRERISACLMVGRRIADFRTFPVNPDSSYQELLPQLSLILSSWRKTIESRGQKDPVKIVKTGSAPIADNLERLIESYGFALVASDEVDIENLMENTSLTNLNNHGLFNNMTWNERSLSKAEPTYSIRSKTLGLLTALVILAASLVLNLGLKNISYRIQNERLKRQIFEKSNDAFLMPFRQIDEVKEAIIHYKKDVSVNKYLKISSFLDALILLEQSAQKVHWRFNSLQCNNDECTLSGTTKGFKELNQLKLFLQKVSPETTIVSADQDPVHDRLRFQFKLIIMK